MSAEWDEIQKELRRMRLAIAILSVIVILLGLLVGLLFQSRQTTIANAMNEVPAMEKGDDSVRVNSEFFLPSLPIPDTLSLAGEPVPLHQADLRERYEFELLVTTYRQSATILGFKRAARWFPIIEPLLASQGIPDDFKYLCVIESNLSHAISPSNAVGFWQFLEGTARQYGLEVNEDVDERYHVEKSTLAACKYLKDAYRKFGSWTLAAASYNMGMAGLDKQMEEQGEKDYYRLKLNQETSRYIFRMAVTKELFEHPDKYGFRFTPEELYAPISTQKLSVDKQVSDWVTFAKEHGTTYYMLKELNPWLRSKQLRNPMHKTYEIQLPN